MVQFIEFLGITALVIALIQGGLVCISVWRKHKAEALLLHTRTTSLQKTADLTFQKARQEIDRQQHIWQDWRKFEIERIVQEASDIKSFYLKPHDRKDIPSFNPGQFLTFKLDIPSGKTVVRCYSLSEAPEIKGFYRVTIKHLQGGSDNPSGVASSYFHDHLSEGDILSIKPPSGHFYLQRDNQRPVVLIGGGIGVTPVLSMLNSICTSEPQRETWFFYGVRNSQEQIDIEPLRQKARQHEHLHVVICHSAPLADEMKGRDFDIAGRISVELLKQCLPSNNYQFYICGPGTMMSALTQQLTDWQVPENDILSEAFGPSSVNKQGAVSKDMVTTNTDKDVSAGQDGAVEEKQFCVNFVKSGVSAQWSASQGSLLELAEAFGLTPDAGCRAGNCGTCAVAIKEGETDYIAPAGSEPEQGSCLLCVSKPKNNIVLDL
ncbi:FAD-binding oxidoreductase [Oceanospirillum sediminis]|uniref:2Fe-2S iron-sulfur cluster binding domain-containing protein n=1 Tax=Oceanospirillum sediminis TaxID=2760088 RepID=A0A839ISE7_9GAMM|nr:FAD-binding oxidoreductase [Oceanospirillum sediminis]MBB1487590.1 2Fe-2S iron-sulfur cluster binding domain-containing protein [Oceanospirillum sediminis]